MRDTHHVNSDRHTLWTSVMCPNRGQQEAQGSPHNSYFHVNKHVNRQHGPSHGPQFPSVRDNPLQSKNRDKYIIFKFGLLAPGRMLAATL